MVLRAFLPPLLVAPLLSCAIGQTTGAPSVGHSAPRASEYFRLGRQIFSSPEDTGSGGLQRADLAEPVQVRLRDLVREAVGATLVSDSPVLSNVITTINNVQGELGFSAAWGVEVTNVPFADFSRLNGTPTLVDAYVIIQGGAVPDSRAYVDFYQHVYGEWQLKATEGREFRGSTFFVSRIRPGISGEEWYLAWGQRLGDTGSRLNVRIYGFNGVTARTVWKRDDLVRGNLQLLDGAVTLDYEERYAPTEPGVKHVHEVLRVTPDGLK